VRYTDDTKLEALQVVAKEVGKKTAVNPKGRYLAMFRRLPWGDVAQRSPVDISKASMWDPGRD